VTLFCAKCRQAIPGLWCNGPCGLLKPATEFSRDATRLTGRCQRCKACERERVRQYTRKKKGQDPGKPARKHTRAAEA
jgi:hypothetical protein